MGSKMPTAAETLPTFSPTGVWIKTRRSQNVNRSKAFVLPHVTLSGWDVLPRTPRLYQFKFYGVRCEPPRVLDKRFLAPVGEGIERTEAGVRDL